MTPADAEVYELGITIFALVALLWAVFAWDERRMTDVQRARAWPPATRGLVVVSPLFAPLWLVGVPLHFARTRRGVAGVLLGIGWFVGVYASLLVIDALVALALGVD